MNVVATFLFVYFVTRLQERLPLSSYRRPLLGIGLCGRLSTLSVVQVKLLMILGLITGLTLGADAALLAGTAAVGSYKTFSRWMFQTQRLRRQNRPAAVDVAGSLVLGVAAAALGRLIGANW